MKTQSELRAFAWGCMFGALTVLFSLIIIRYTMGIAWQPVSVW